MTRRAADGSLDAIRTALLDRLHTQRLELEPKGIEFEIVTDGLGDDAWRIILILPRPTQGAWDSEQVFLTRQAATAAFDELIASSGRALLGHTLARVTTDEAAIDETAVVDAPEPGEDPGHPNQS